MTPKNYPGAQALLEKFHAGKCTPEELALLDKWYNSLGEGTAVDLEGLEADLRRQQFLEQFRRTVLPAPRLAWWRRPAIRWAAAACIVLMAGAGWLSQQRAGKQASAPVLADMVTITNETSGIKQLTLPDGSRVWLNAHASIAWKKDFNRRERSVTLTGEGFFDIHASEQAPFVVHTRDMAIQVLGTQFNVEAYAGENTTRVSLLQGKVQVKAQPANARPLVLQPGYAAACRTGDSLLQLDETDANKVAAWKNGAFTATDIPFKDAVERLCDRYGYAVNWKNKQDIEKNITVMFETDSFTGMLDNICYISRKQYKISGKEVTIF
ncbi:FecR family protein [Chitinophaga qingshengii]|uniref:FecR domain-containing protein n=1 Tax=Chitinophaga qingshengii TaxID=1569794 RepID=A0ABR7TJ52_9BACT|nr:FecR family protein [Chitinophaga qingshengii]MBC9930532.1 FecR domain-containing protein [Chitinophaga qingshengii]